MASIIESVVEILKNKRGMWIISAAIVVLLAAAGLWIGFGGAGQDGTAITIAAKVWPEEAKVEVEQTVAYRNNTGGELSELVFFLYPVAYGSQDTAPVDIDEYDAAYPNGFSVGNVLLGSIAVGGNAVDCTTEGVVLHVPLNTALKDGASVEVSLSYALLLPDCRSRFGAGEHTVNLLNAFAIPAVHDAAGWRTDPYTAVGDPFYSECADYRVTLEVPEGMIVAATGSVDNEKTTGKRTTYTFSAPGARDFAAVLSSEYATAKAEVGDVLVVSHAPTQESADRALSYAAQAVAAMTATYGPCAYKEVEVCSADLLTGGMEYPGLAVIDRTLYQTGEEAILEYCIAHEVAHQWWYGAVGSDQIREPWMDESLAEYSTLVYYEQTYGPEGFQSAYRKFIRPRLLGKGLSSVPVGRSITSFADNGEYAAVVYAKGAAMWHALRMEMGDEAFFAGLRKYYDDNALTNASKQDLYQAMGGDAAAFIEEWLTGRAP